MAFSGACIVPFPTSAPLLAHNMVKENKSPEAIIMITTKRVFASFVFCSHQEVVCAAVCSQRLPGQD